MIGIGEIAVLMIAIVIVYFIFGKNLPKIAKDAGKAIREFKNAVKEPGKHIDSAVKPIQKVAEETAEEFKKGLEEEKKE